MAQEKPISKAIEMWRIKPFTSFGELLDSSEEGETLIGRAIKSLLEFNSGDYHNSKGRTLAQEVIKENIDMDINLYAMFLMVWSITAAKGLNLGESKLILKKLDELDQQSLYPEIQATILATVGYYKAVSGNKTGRILYLQKALKIKDLNDVHLARLIFGMQGALQSLGQLKDMENQASEILKKNLEAFSKIEHDLALFSNAVQLCQISLAKKLLAEFKSDPVKLKRYTKSENENDVTEIYLSFIEQPLSAPFTKNSLENSALTYYEKWITATGYLYKGEPQTGLIWARKCVSEHPIGMRNRNLQSFTLIRGELANKNCEAAKNLLAIKINEGYPHFFDDFFNARIALLENKKDLAQNYFNQLHLSCLHYEAFGRLEFELQLACELSAEDIQLFISKPIEYSGGSEFKTVVPNISPNETPEDELMGNSEMIKTIKQQIKKAATNTGIVLLYGETGVGKEVVSKSIHQNSPQKNKPYIPINCGAISESLLQSELFGHVAGAFTGAYKYQPGVFESAADGTVFLDEIGEITPQVQIALLRVLEKREIRPIGSTSTKKINCKIIAATNKKLEELVAKGIFREDLYYRLDQNIIFIPPLRARNDDILLLANHFLSHNRSDGQRPSMNNELQELIKKYAWPGNVRQLKNEIEKMRLLNSEKLTYTAEDFTMEVNNQKNTFNSTSQSKEILTNPTLKTVIKNEKTPFRRKEKILELFMEAGALTRGEIIKALNISPGTATTDLKLLEKEGLIQRIKPSASTRTHFFEFCKK